MDSKAWQRGRGRRMECFLPCDGWPISWEKKNVMGYVENELYCQLKKMNDFFFTTKYVFDSQWYLALYWKTVKKNSETFVFVFKVTGILLAKCLLSLYFSVWTIVLEIEFIGILQHNSNQVTQLYHYNFLFNCSFYLRSTPIKHMNNQCGSANHVEKKV